MARIQKQESALLSTAVNDDIARRHRLPKVCGNLCRRPSCCIEVHHIQRRRAQQQREGCSTAFDQWRTGTHGTGPARCHLACLLFGPAILHSTWMTIGIGDSSFKITIEKHVYQFHSLNCEYYVYILIKCLHFRCRRESVQALSGRHCELQSHSVYVSNTALCLLPPAENDSGAQNV